MAGPSKAGTLPLKARKLLRSRQCGVSSNSAVVGTGRERDTPPLALQEKVVGLVLQEGRRQQRIDLIRRRHALVGRRIGGITGEVGQADHLAQRLPLLRRQRGDADPAVGRAIDGLRIGRAETVYASPDRGRSALVEAGPAVLRQADIGFEDGDIDALLGLSLAAADQGGECGDERGGAGNDLRCMALGQGGRSVCRAERIGDAAHRLDHTIAAAPGSVGPAVAEPGEREEKGAPLHLRDQGFGVGDIGRCLARDDEVRLHACRDTARLFLAAVEPGSIGRRSCPAVADMGIVGLEGADHAGAVLGEELAAVSGGNIPRHFENDEIRQRRGHAVRS